MAEPASSAASGIALSAGVITITGSFLGLQYDYLLAGMFGGLVALSFASQSSRMRMAASVVASAVLAAFSTPIIALLAAEHFPSIARAGEEPLRMFCAVLIGISTQTVVPLGLNILKNRLGGQK